MFSAFVRLACLFLVILSSAASAQQSNLLRAEDAFRLSAAREDGRIALRWTIADGYYLYRDQIEAKDAATGGDVPLQTEPGIVEKNDANFGPSEVFYRQATARLDANAPEQVTLSYRGCKKDSICYPPVTVKMDTRALHISAPMKGFGLADEPQASETQSFQLAEGAQSGGMVASLLAAGGAFWVIGSFLVFGLLLAFTPCVLPMYPILSATLARQGEKLTAKRGLVLSSAYVLAMALAFAMLGVVAAWSGRNLQVVLQSPYAVAAVAFLFALLAASMFGLFELQLPSRWVNRMAGVGAQSRGFVAGAAAMGFVSALIVGPCVTAPLAAALLYIAQTGDALLGASALFALGLGQGLPLIAFGAIGSRALPRAGVWMEQVKYVFGFVFLGAAIWMASRLLAAQATLALWAALLLTAAIFAGATDHLPGGASSGARFRKAAGLTLALAGVILALGAASGGTDPLRPLAHLAGASQPFADHELTFKEAQSTQALKDELAASDGRPSLVYFTADWCVTCRMIERDVLPDPEIAAGLKPFQRIKVDLSRLDDANQELMQKLAVVGPPTMIFFDQHAKERNDSRLVGDVTVDSLRASIADTKR